MSRRKEAFCLATRPSGVSSLETSRCAQAKFPHFLMNLASHHSKVRSKSTVI